MIGAQGFEILFGRSAAKKIIAMQRKVTTRQIAWETLTTFKNKVLWSHALKKFLETADATVFDTCPDGLWLLEPKISSPLISKEGRCGGSVTWRPGAAYVAAVGAHFRARGCPLPSSGEFSTVQFQLLLGNTVARQTIFANPEFREALAAAARYILRRRLSE